jgi:hypothetical protein
MILGLLIGLQLYNLCDNYHLIRIDGACFFFFFFTFLAVTEKLHSNTGLRN